MSEVPDSTNAAALLWARRTKEGYVGMEDLSNKAAEFILNAAGQVEQSRGSGLSHEELERQQYWKKYALQIGEMLARTGPDGYYSFEPVDWQAWCQERINEIYLRAEAAELEAARLRGFLKRMRQWDMLDTSSDGSYWRGEIDRALTAKEQQ